MPENASSKGAFLNAATGNRNSGGNRSSYQDKDKPAQIRFSNISAGKGDGGLSLEGGAPEIELGYSRGLSGMESFCVPASGKFHPPWLKMAGPNLISTVTELRRAQGEKTVGINVRKVNTR